MWIFLKIFIFMLLIVILLGALGYILVDRWLVKRIDARVVGEERDTPDVVMEREPPEEKTPAAFVPTEKNLNPIVEEPEDEEESDEFDMGFLSD